jgi:hypothetical protein
MELQTIENRISTHKNVPQRSPHIFFRFEKGISEMLNFKKTIKLDIGIKLQIHQNCLNL